MRFFLLSLFLLLTAAPYPNTIYYRFRAPEGYHRVSTTSGTFADYLQNVPLKPAGAHAKTYQGKIAATDEYTAAVVKLSLGHQDLQQCADAVMRLRAEYLFQQKNYASIVFKFTNGFRCEFLMYANGFRYNSTTNRWVLKQKKDNSYATFLEYMDLVFSYAGTLSLEKELKKVSSGDDIKIGDVFIRGGSPGHCFIVMDVAQNDAHKKIFLLAQSFMPAQDIQILQNGSPWFSLSRRAGIPYEELIDIKYLRRFE